MSFNNFLQGVATQVINTGLKKVAGNLPGLNLSYPSGSNSSLGGVSFDQLPLGPSANFTHYTFPLDVMADPGLGNQGHYVMFYINEQQNAKIRFGGKGGASTAPTGTSERGIPSSIKKLASNGEYIKTVNTKKDIATSKFIKWYISLIVGDNITKIIGAKNELKKIIYNKFTPSGL